eukprot:CAMPEP_0185728490 /NCGR_PEP_ID=MMETSP1171-20130828/3812_1 /TAXON_ID=374046 /ORGANISM="Helicotheca tamensis, Strain CCMP826" /LENGTH=246 /DNA_ID=CAMNT_0028397205 /DNA_START=124 /DNA_END=864 /DNA_ORIENTATION=-
MPSIMPLSVPAVCKASRSNQKKDAPSNKTLPQDQLTLEEFSIELPQLIHKIKAIKKKKKGNKVACSTNNKNGGHDDPIANLLRQVVLSEEDWKRYALFDPTKNYTRNLISTDDSTYTLIMLCWNPGKESPIHDHPCDGCWMQVCQGSVRECRYEKVNEKTVKDVMNDRLWCNSRHTYHEGQLAYIDDFMGYHKVGNPSETVPAVTLHLYCPPFDKCKIWLDPDHASKPSVSHVCYHSQFGCRRTID